MNMKLYKWYLVIFGAQEPGVQSGTQPVASIPVTQHQEQLWQPGEFKNAISGNNEPIKIKWHP